MSNVLYPTPLSHSSEIQDGARASGSPPLNFLALGSREPFETSKARGRRWLSGLRRRPYWCRSRDRSANAISMLCVIKHHMT